MTKPMTDERRTEIRADKRAMETAEVVELLDEVDRLRALWAAVAKDSRERKAEADGRRQHNQRLEDELATRTAQLELRDAEIRRLRTLVDKAEQTLPIEQRRLLSISRMVFDHIAAGRPITRDEAADLAQRIVDEIGHSVTDEPALGPNFRVEIDQLNATIARVRTLHTRCEGHTRDCDDCLGRNDICSWCGDPYPCPTIAALDQPAG